MQNQPKNIKCTGYLKDGEIKALMHHCIAFIQPSIYEGFGIPPLEAMSTGARCIVAKSSSLPEIYQNSVWYLDPLDYSNIDLKKIMANNIDDNNSVLRRFSWAESAMKLRLLCEKLCGGSKF